MRILIARTKHPLATLLAMGLLLMSSSAHAAETSKDLVKASLVADVGAITPGQTFTLGVRMELVPHWHTYWINPGETGQPTEIKLTGPKGLTFGQIRWPVPTKIVMDGAITYGYENEVLLTIPVTVAKDLAIDGQVTIDADVNWLSCKETCVEGSARLSIKLPISTKAQPANQELFARWSRQLPIEAKDVSGMVAKIEQPTGADGKPAPALTVQWKKKPAKVEWYPAATPAVAIEDVQVDHEGEKTQVTFTTEVFQPDEVPGGMVDGVLVFENEAGQRVGVRAPVKVALKK